MPLEHVVIDRIRQDADSQPRAHFDYTAAEEYGDDIANGAEFPPVVLFFDGENYWPGDGFHRIKATELHGWQGEGGQREATKILAEVHSGTLQDARWFACGANKTNGIRRTNEDKARAVKRALEHPKGAGLSDHQIAEHVGVAVSTVGDWRKRLAPTVGNLQSGKRIGKDKRVIDISKIGKRSKIKPPKIGSTPPVPPRTPTPRTQRLHSITGLILNFMDEARHLAELVEWESEQGHFDEAENTLDQVTAYVVSFNKLIEDVAVSKDSANRSRLHIPDRDRKQAEAV